MTKIQKSIVVIALAVMLIFTYAVNVQAITVSNIEYDGSNVTVIENGGVYYLTLTGNAVQDIEINSGETVVIDLGGYNLTNFTDGLSTISIASEATVIITGTGTITNTSNSGVPVIGNTGTLYVQGGTIVSDNGSNSTGIYNSGTVYVSGGEITTTADNCWGLTNEGTAVISGGTFTQSGNYSVIMNAGNMTISGGTIDVNSGWAAITNDARYTQSDVSLTISNVTVTGAEGGYVISNNSNESNEAEVTVTGGSYGTNTNIGDFLDDSYTVDTNGNVVEVEEEVVTPSDPVEGDETGEAPAGDEGDEITSDDETIEATEETTEEEAITESETETTSNPSTGDAIMVFAVVFVIALAGIVVTIKMRKRAK